MATADDGRLFTAYWRGVRHRTVRLFALVPEERLEWAPAPGRWTLADQFRHLAAIERWMYGENAAGRPSRYPGHGPDLATGSAAIAELTSRWHAEACGIFEGLSVEHEAHHRGQIYLLLGMLGLDPPQLFGLPEEEVRRRSGREAPAP